MTNPTQNKKMPIQHYYSERATLLKQVVEEVNGIIEEYRYTQEGLLKGLEDILGKKSLRHIDFEKMIHELIEMQSNREEEVRKTLWEFLKETEQIASRLGKLLRAPDVKKFKKFIAEVRARQRKKKIEIGEMIEQRFDDTECNMQSFLNEFKNERIALNGEWEKLREEKERFGHIGLLINDTPTP